MYSIAFHFLDAHISACDLRSMDAPAGELAGQEVDVVLLPPSPRAVAGVNGGGGVSQLMVQFRNFYG